MEFSEKQISELIETIISYMAIYNIVTNTDLNRFDIVVKQKP